LIEKIILLPDIHYPHQDKTAIKAVFEFIKWFEPNTVVLLGDALEMESINHWQKEKGNRLFQEDKRLLEEYEGFDREILTPLDRLCEPYDKRRRKPRKIYMGGNHEHWLNGLFSKFPEFIGMLGIEKTLKLKERKWEWIPFMVNDSTGVHRGIVQFGKLLVFHGQYLNKYHAAKTAETYSKSCAYGHTHDIQFYTKVFADDIGYHSAQSIGCLCNRSPAFKWGKANRWVNAFGIIYLRESGMFNLYVPIIIEGKFVYAGKLFDGNK